MGFFDDLIKKTVVNWLAKQLGVSPALLSGIIDGIVVFLKEILGNLSPQEQRVFFQLGGKALAGARPEQVKQILRDLQVKFAAMGKPQ